MQQSCTWWTWLDQSVSSAGRFPDRCDLVLQLCGSDVDATCTLVHHSHCKEVFWRFTHTVTHGPHMGVSGHQIHDWISDSLKNTSATVSRCEPHACKDWLASVVQLLPVCELCHYVASHTSRRTALSGNETLSHTPLLTIKHGLSPNLSSDL